MSKYLINENFFENIITEDQAYFLGIMYSDGCVCNNSIIISQIEENSDIVYKFKKALSSNHPIKIIKPVHKNVYSLRITNKKLALDLITLGCVPSKSLILQFPSFISEELMPHFIRGLFDGDGCIWDGKRKKMTVKDNTRKEGKRERIVHNVKFTYTGNIQFVTALQKYLYTKLSLTKITKLNFSKANNPNNTTSANVCTMEYSGRKNIKKLYDYLYTNATIFSENKKLKFEKILCASVKKLTEDTSLTAGTPEMVISNQASLEEGSTTIPEMGVESSDSKCEALNG